MHSRSNSLENISIIPGTSSGTAPFQVQALAQQKGFKYDEPSRSFQGSSQSCHRESPDSMNMVHRKNKSSCCSQANNKKNELTEQTTLGNSRDLSHDDLLLLLSILEGELQARDEVITVLRAEKTDLALLEAHYGFVTPPKVLQALQRDTILGKGHGWQDDIYEKPIAELDKLVEKQKETYSHMLEQLLLVEQAHKQTLYRLEDEKQNHSEYMKKSDEFTSLLEQERERLKLLNDQEKSYQEKREEENNRKITNLKEELTKLKSFALLIIDEQQCVSEKLVQQTARVRELQAAAREAQEELSSVQSRAQKMESKVLHLQTELHDQAVQFHQEKEAMSIKLADENSQNRHLHQKLSTLCQEMDELEKTNKALRRAEEELQELRDKKSKGEIGNPSLVSEVEELRKRVVEMEGKDEELIKMEDLCRDLNRKLEREAIQNRSLKTEVDKLNHRIPDIEKLEYAFIQSKQECSSLKCNLEKEKAVSKHMCNELGNLRIRIKEFEAAESLLEKTEWTLKEDLTKLKTLTVMLIDDRKNMAEKLKQLENKFQDSTDKLQAEQDKVTLVTEKLIEESKRALKIKVEMEEKICITAKEREELKVKIKAEEEKSNALQSKVSLMKKRLQSLEAVEREFLKNKVKQENTKGPIQNGFQQENNKMKDLTQEVEWLKRKLREMNVVEEDLLKTQNEGESFEKRYSNEKSLTEELEIARKELYKYQMVEKENFNQEHILYKQLKEEEAKSSHLTKEVEALKEKIHNYMGTEESICNMKTKYATLQRKLTQQEIRNKELVREKESLTRELERYRRFSKSLRPGMIGRRFSDLQVSTKEVQTESPNGPTYKNLTLLEQAVENENMYKESNQHYEPNYNEMNPAKCGTSLKNNNNHQNNTKQIRNPILNSVEKQQLINCKMQNTQNGSHIQQGVTHNLSQHLRIKKTPDNSHNTATFEITNATSENSQSYSTTAVIPNGNCTRKQQITITQNAPASPQNNKCHPSTESLFTSEQSMTPHSTTTYSQTVISEFTSLLTPNSAMLPTDITTITTGGYDRSQETDINASHTVFCETPQRQNNWHAHSYNSSSPSVNNNEDNKLPIHLGIPYPPTINNTEPPCYSPGQEQKSSELTSGILTKVNSKTVSSLGIKPASTPIPQPSQSTVPVEAFQQCGPTRIPKPKVYSTPTGTNSRAALTQSSGTAQALPKLGKNIYSDLNTEILSK
ncbi:filamin A-interacting protein 1-like isoform X1 [Hemibagrus wyckioides]|uniref:filamin A-interacting protein 1-like isoform X1 n=1 Tax=Hemibagrus wyckioides TaxID=337641 RepID=UPI00266CB412|nr:filamin A-interacting protein 1-like isoform X1 [Hemibagrus wyckioides]